MLIVNKCNELNRPHDHLPVIEDDVFSRHRHAAYNVALVALRDEEILPSAYRASRQLRFNKYNSLGWLPDEAMDPDGGEHDDDDIRSAHFAVIANEGADQAPRLIATSRLILKDVEPIMPLPVETHFVDAFKDQPAGSTETEASRMISDSKNRIERSLATFATHRAMIGFGFANGYNRANAIVEDWMLKRFDETHLPYDRLAEFTTVAEYGNTVNTAIAIDPEQVVQSTKILRRNRVPILTSLFFRNVKKDQGVGFYNKNFLARYRDE